MASIEPMVFNTKLIVLQGLTNPWLSLVAAGVGLFVGARRRRRGRHATSSRAGAAVEQPVSSLEDLQVVLERSRAAPGVVNSGRSHCLPGEPSQRIGVGWSRGFLRVWIVLSILWVSVIGFVSYIDCGKILPWDPYRYSENPFLCLYPFGFDRRLAWMLFPPLALLCAGIAVDWCCRGFRRDSPPTNSN